MELFGGLPLPLSLAVLALIDGLSVGTLLIPVFLLLHPGRVRVGRILLYLGTIAAFYLVVGLLFLWGLVNLVDVAADFLGSPAGMIIRLVVGAALLITALVMPTKPSADAGAAHPAPHADASPPPTFRGAAHPAPRTDSPPSPAASRGAVHPDADRASDDVLSVWARLGAPATAADVAPSAAAAAAAAASEPRAAASPPHFPAANADAAPAAPRPGHLLRWRERLLDPRTRGVAVMAVAVAAGLVEVATMLPYIVAMTMLAEAGVDTSLRVLSLAGYCALMIAPAVVLLVLRLVARGLVQRPLERFAAWMERTGAENTAWIIGGLGFLIARSAATELGLFDAIGSVL